MKILSLQIKNIGKIVDEFIEFNKPLNLFYGEILAGKTTILNAVKLCFGGSFPDDIIRHGEKEASILLKFENGSIRRTFYIAKDGSVKDRSIEFIEDGVNVKKPTDVIKKMLNPFLLNQNHLIEMSVLLKKKFFADLLDIDTSEFDEKAKKLEGELLTLKIDIRAAGKIELEEVYEPEKIDDLDKKLTKLLAKFNEDQNFNTDQIQKKKDIDDNIEAIEKLKTTLSKLPKPEKEKDLTQADKELTKINNKISNLKADIILYDLFLENKKKADEKIENEALFKKKLGELNQNRKKRLKLLAEISKNCEIKELEFDKEGEVIYQKTAIDMLSTSQLMNLSSECSALYPEGLGLELLDHGESLGFAVQGSAREPVSIYVKRAKAQNKTILAAIVGESPGDLPENVGVFIVKEGKIEKSGASEEIEDDDGLL